MNDNKPQVATWALCVDIDPDNPESDPMVIATLDLPLDALKGGLVGVSLDRDMGKATALAARIICQSIDVALKRHIERGGIGTLEMLTGLHIDPMGDIRENR